MTTSNKTSFEKYWKGFFEFGIFFKGINGVWELIVGFFLLVTSKSQLNRVFFHFTRGELLEDPKDRVILFLSHVFYNFNNAKTFAGIYILFHGCLNLFLAISLYKNKLWAYPVTLVSMLLFISYQVYRFSYTHSPFLAVISIFDAAFIIAAWHEYKYQKVLMHKN